MAEKVRVLVVTDDFGSNGHPHGGFLRWSDQAAADATGPSSREFHLGEFVHCLETTSWLGFTVELTKAHRATPAAAGLSEAALRADRGADVVGFRFNQPFSVAGENRTLANYDMILFFAINPVDPDVTLNAEASAIAEFMENGGGFFATGDHANLGAELCGLIPRVRSMRRWWSSTGPNGEPAAPPPLGATRHDTTRAGADGVTNFEDQSDDVAQEIAPTLYGAGLSIKGGYPASRYLPHPLLCSPDGQVKFLPDHMHEGTCEVPDNLGARTFTLNGALVREYPDYTPPNAAPNFIAAPLSPEIVANGKVLAGVTSPALDTPVHVGDSTPAQGTTFGVIGAWDGHRVGKGRVVVDSTWHHFFNINLSGDRYLETFPLPANQSQKLHGFYVPDGNGGRTPNDEYRMIMWYYRNIVYWLIPANRLESIWWESLSRIGAHPQLREEFAPFDRNFKYGFDHFMYFGQLAEAYLSKARGACASYLVHRYIYKEKIPWWEWVEQVVDVWDPLQAVRASDRVQHGRWLGAMGVAARPELTATLALGAAMVTLASIQAPASGKTEREPLLKALRSAWPRTLNQAVAELGIQLRAAKELELQLEKLVLAQLAAKAG